MRRRLDVDEFYFSHELKRAKRFIVNSNYTHCYCGIVSYGLNPTNRLNNYSCASNFFSRINKSSIMNNRNNNIPCKIDPTRKLSHYMGAKYYYLSNICIHHYSLVRKNLQQKLDNSSFNNSGCTPLLKIKKDDVFVVPDYFGIENQLATYSDNDFLLYN